MKRLIALVALFAWSVAGVAFAQAPPACPSDATSLAAGAKLKCTCDGPASGGVYGSVRYTADSSICTAAKHAGKPAGPVDIVVGGACPSFPGTAANGVTTASWSSFEKSYSFGETLAPVLPRPQHLRPRHRPPQRRLPVASPTAPPSSDRATRTSQATA